MRLTFNNLKNYLPAKSLNTPFNAILFVSNSYSILELYSFDLKNKTVLSKDYFNHDTLLSIPFYYLINHNYFIVTSIKNLNKEVKKHKALYESDFPF